MAITGDKAARQEALISRRRDFVEKIYEKDRLVREAASKELARRRERLLFYGNMLTRTAVILAIGVSVYFMMLWGFDLLLAIRRHLGAMG